MPNFPPIARDAITGLILAGGRGQRMGGRDKGLQLYDGRPLAAHVLARLAPQVGAVLISANRNHAAYSALGADVVSDETQDFAGPLAGMLSGLRAAKTEYVLTAPCDSPLLPDDLALRLTAALIESAQSSPTASANPSHSAGMAPPPLTVTAAYAVTSEGPHPVFALLHRSLADDLAATLAAGEHRVRAWLARHKAVQVHFGDERPFYNANTLDDLHTDTPRAPRNSGQ
ncbi:molybdenum cofactor guanylyltransferase MobA [Pandoraea pneumonica]|uniref:Molybdenum cofactor guanylyltransferase n=1 Tax=Pandoraea pneumonica TaxID=2508299 RepID=A0A5E4WYZ1_9BURK|nr:molybdenum cofactor guanylyltransferase MobA [Pandoraea pneumonica]VVE29390.1 molybdenum cofactor guanylyltransferase MobA [Pandoraea pneumonica]